MKEKITFENFLRDKYYKEYHGTDDDMSDAFDKWLTELQVDDFIKYGDEYADWKMKELHKQRILKKFGSEDAKRQYFMQKQRECRARKKLSNKDKIK